MGHFRFFLGKPGVGSALSCCVVADGKIAQILMATCACEAGGGLLLRVCFAGLPFLEPFHFRDDAAHLWRVHLDGLSQDGIRRAAHACGVARCFVEAVQFVELHEAVGVHVGGLLQVAFRVVVMSQLFAVVRQEGMDSWLSTVHLSGIGPQFIIPGIERVGEYEHAVRHAVRHLELLALHEVAVRREQFHVEDPAQVGECAPVGLRHVTLVPDGVADEITGIVEVQVHLLLRQRPSECLHLAVEGVGVCLLCLGGQKRQKSHSI